MGRRGAIDIRRNARSQDGIASGGGAAPFVGILDSVMATAIGAWSISDCLRAAYSGPLIRVRRASDSAEQDIGQNASRQLDTAALDAFCSGTDGFLRTVYGQDAGAGLNLGHATAANQPQIYRSATGVVLVGTASIPAGDWDGSNDRLVRADALGQTGNPAITIIGNHRLDASIVSDRFSFGIGNTPVSPNTAILHMALGVSNTPSVSFVSQNCQYTLGANPAMTAWQYTMVARDAAAQQQNTDYYVNGTALTLAAATNPTNTPTLQNDATSWGDGLDAGVAFWAGEQSTVIVFSSRITAGSADKTALDAWFAARL